MSMSLSLVRGVAGRFVRRHHAIHPTGRRDAAGNTIAAVDVRFGGQTIRFHVREGTVDLDIVSMIVQRDSEYRLPAMIKPKLIFDVGANIGATAAYYACVYPEAQICCFEPLPENLHLLEANVKCFGGRVCVLPYGLYDQPGELTYHRSGDPRNFGGGGFVNFAHDDAKQTLPLKTTAMAMDELGISSVDVFKIDTEGAELPVLRGIPEMIRRNAQAFIGELHGVNDWKFCDLLSESHALSLNKALNRGCHPILAVRKDLVK